MTSAIKAVCIGVLVARVAVLPLSAGATPPLATPRGDPPRIASPAAAAVEAAPRAADPAASDPAQPPADPPQPMDGKTITDCPSNAPYQLEPGLCLDQEALNTVDKGWKLTINPETGEVTWTPPPHYNPTTEQWGSYKASTQACDPTLEVKLKEAALAGSQLTRAISDRQMSYPRVDPLEAVNNPRKDGYGGVCTVDLFAFDLGRLLGSTYDQIKNLIDTLSQLSVDSLFGAACKVVNSIFGNLQNQLLQDVQSHSPLTAFQQFLNQLQTGYITPMQSFLSYGSGLHPTTATLPGVITATPLQVSYVPGKGYVYMADFGSGNRLVLRISQTPLVPADAVTPTAAR